MSQLSKSNNSNKTERIIQDWHPEDNKFWLQTGKNCNPQFMDLYSMFVISVLCLDAF